MRPYWDCLKSPRSRSATDQIRLAREEILVVIRCVPGIQKINHEDNAQGPGEQEITRLVLTSAGFQYCHAPPASG